MANTVRIRRGAATVNAARRELLKYVLIRKGPGAVFVVTSPASSTPIFSMDELGGANLARYEWELRARKEGAEAVYTFHKTTGEQIGAYEFRTDDDDAIEVFTVVLSFMFLGKYTLKVDHCKSSGLLLKSITDIDFQSNSNTSTETSSITVNVAGIA